MVRRKVSSSTPIKKNLAIAAALKLKIAAFLIKVKNFCLVDKSKRQVKNSNQTIIIFCYYLLIIGDDKENYLIE